MKRENLMQAIDIDGCLKQVEKSLEQVAEFNNHLCNDDDDAMLVIALGRSTGNHEAEAFISLKLTKEIIDKITDDLMSQKKRLNLELERL